MPIILALMGIVLLITTVNGNVVDLGRALREDVFGSNGYIRFVIAIFIVGSLGYVKALRPFSNAFLALILLVLIFSGRGFFDRLNEAIAQMQSMVRGSQ